MTTETVSPAEAVAERPVKAARDLKPGDWIHSGFFGFDTQVRAVVPFVSRMTDRVLIVHAEDEGGEPDTGTADADDLVPMVTDAERADAARLARRRAFITDLRFFATWLESGKGASLPQPYASFQTDLHGPGSVEEVRALAVEFGLEVRELSDRTQVELKVGSLRYPVIAWHRDGNDAEAAR